VQLLGHRRPLRHEGHVVGQHALQPAQDGLACALAEQRHEEKRLQHRGCASVHARANVLCTLWNVCARACLTQLNNQQVSRSKCDWVAVGLTYLQELRDPALEALWARADTAACSLLLLQLPCLLGWQQQTIAPAEAPGLEPSKAGLTLLFLCLNASIHTCVYVPLSLSHSLLTHSLMHAHMNAPAC